MAKERFRFTLQWPADTEARRRAGLFLTRIANKKSEYVVAALNAWLDTHPEWGEGAPTLPVMLTEKDLRSMLDEHMREVKELVSTARSQAAPAAQSPDAEENGLDDMLDALDSFL